jgi:hypothetical protein
MGFAKGGEVAPQVGTVSLRNYVTSGVGQDGILWIYGYQTGGSEVYVE